MAVPERNEVSAASIGGVVQAGVVHGGLHVHPPPAAPDQSALGRLVRRSADELAGRLEAQWQAAAAERGLVDRPLNVHWRWSPLGISGPPQDAVGDARRVRFAPLPGLPRVGAAQLVRGEAGDLFGVYGGLDSGRIVLVGDAGSGKSGAMIRLLLDAVAHRAGLRDPAIRERVPVPVLLTAFDWVPRRERFAAWVTRRLEAEHGFLKKAYGSVTVARALVESGRISVLLDGVDEMAPGARDGVLREVSRQAGCRVVLSSRSRELVQAVTGGHLRGAAALELIAIGSAQAAEHLSLRVVHPIPAGWRTVIDRLRANGDPALAGALDSPLMLGLLLDTYLPYDPVDELCDRMRFPTRQTVEDHLLSRVLPAAYGTVPEPEFTLPQARRWLGHLAGRMSRDGTRDLAWWRIARWQPAWPRIAVAGLTVGMTDGVTCGVAFGPVTGVVVGLGVGLVVVLTGRLGDDKFNRYPPQFHGVRWNRQSIKVGLTFGLSRGPAAALAFGLGAVITGGLAFGFAVGSPLGGVVGGVTTVLVAMIAAVLTDALGTAHPMDGLLTPVNSWRGNGRMVVASGLAVGLASGLVYGLVSGAFPDTNGLAFGVASGLALGVPFAIRAGSPFTWSAVLTFAQLRRAGHGPQHMMRFLEDARARGVLRTAGPVYQFRHARLQDLLAESAD